MRSSILLASLASSTVSAETVLGAYIFSRHGDRTAKSTPPTELTDLGYQEIFTSGSYYRSRYVASDASRRIHGIAPDIVKLSQITASAPVDNVLQASGIGFLQGLYPPVGETLGSQTLRNSTVIQAPMNGYQLLPLQVVQNGANSEDAAWLQGATNCANAQISSNDYFRSSEYNDTLARTKEFYANMHPYVERTFAEDQTSFKNAYTIWDLLNVASIHNASVALPDDADFFQLRTLADQHEYGLAYNASEPIRAVTGSIIAAEVTDALNGTITGKGKNVLNIQFGAYAGMLSYFGLANLTAASTDFYGVPDYASSLVWELVTNATVSNTSYPTADDISVRFFFHNGTTSNISEPVEFPLFGTGRSPLPWSEFVASTAKFSIGTQAEWCSACGNSTGVCSPAALGGEGASGALGTSSSDDSSGGHKGGISKAVAGVIGAMVTLGVILGLEILFFTVGGFRLVSKKRLARNASNGSGDMSGSGVETKA
ncbi:acid phosphatase [Cladophialophora yegresii CBS 114405]|uniref:Acid phosphatase n=1 Tax=Cladophialophora yegresii CBS 114405 TaxID=1182544 RepID=W9VY01_9EURO|nr:acid phosphatase [Cladophialophora yegresii CBS 114405]EXJ60717.1 acid phosphatase [Cladophialophora yegresii CBS 114405]